MWTQTPSRTPISGDAVKRARAEESNGRRGKPRSKRRFYLALPLTKLSSDRFEHRFRLYGFCFASFKLVIPLERM